MLEVRQKNMLKQGLGSKKAITIFAHLENYFAWARKNGRDSIWKFLSRCPKHKGYRQGDSWEELTGFKRRAFNTAFSKMGVRYRSKTEYMKAPDKFQGKLYACYYERKSNKMIFMRNDGRVVAFLKKMNLTVSKVIAMLKGIFHNTYSAKSQKTYYNQSKPSIKNGHSQNVANSPPNARAYSNNIYNNNIYKTSTNSEKPEKSDIPPKSLQEGEGDKCKVQKMVDIWNTAMQDHVSSPSSLDTISSLLNALRDFFKNSLKEWEAYCYRVASSRFCYGETYTVKKFKAWLYWAIKPEIISKIKQGFYGVGTRLVKSPTERQEQKILHEVQNVAYKLQVVEIQIESARKEILWAQRKCIQEKVGALSQDELETFKKKFMEKKGRDSFCALDNIEFRAYLDGLIYNRLGFCHENDIQAPEELLTIQDTLLSKKEALLNQLENLRNSEEVPHGMPS